MWDHVLSTPRGTVAPPLVPYAELLAETDRRAHELAAELAQAYPQVHGGN